MIRFARRAALCLALCLVSLASAAAPTPCKGLDAAGLAKLKISMKPVKTFCYTDKSGSYQVYLTEKLDKFPGKAPLSTVLEAQIVKIPATGNPVISTTVRETSTNSEAGGYFSSKLLELSDIDGDGLVDPIVVFRFCEKDGNGGYDEDPFSGRMKTVIVHKGAKASVDAVTGTLDNERSTKGDAAYFALPAKVQAYLVKKFGGIYSAKQFGYDNSKGFKPTK